MTTLGSGDANGQRNSGSGTFINGNVFGGIHNHHVISEETKDHIKTIAESSPTLARFFAEQAAMSGRSAETAELIATTARRFQLADSAELLAKAAAILHRMSLPECAQSLAGTTKSLQSLLPELHAVARQVNLNSRG